MRGKSGAKHFYPSKKEKFDPNVLGKKEFHVRRKNTQKNTPLEKGMIRRAL